MTIVDAIALQAVDSNTYKANLDRDWCIGNVPHGGYVTAAFLYVVRKHFASTLSKQNQPHTIALHLSFLRRTQTGPATFSVKDIKLGRQTSVVHVTLSQDGREEVVGYFTNSNITNEKGASFATNWALHPNPLPANLSLLESGVDPNWIQKREWPNEEFRKATKHIMSWFPRPGQPQQSGYDQWLCFRDTSARWTNEKLGYLVDVFPQILESYLLDGVDVYHPDIEAKYSREEVLSLSKSKTPFWYPTVVLNLDVKKALPEEGVKFLFTRVQAKSIKDGRYDLEITVLDEAGDVVALSNHVCFAVSASRNVAARKKAEQDPKL